MKLNSTKRKAVKMSLSPVFHESRKTPYEFTLTVPVENFFWRSVKVGGLDFNEIQADELITQPKRLPRSPVFTSKIVKF